MISFVAAMDKNRLIGKDNQLPWHLPADLKHFKKVTSGGTIVMGRKTFESIGKPLPNRRNIIVTKNKTFQADGCEVIYSLEEVQELGKKEEEFFVIGGAEIFNACLPYADKMYLTHIDESFEGDTFFPEWNTAAWEKLEEEQGAVDDKNKHPHRFITWQKSKK
ncbi:dihydrofolate reductase [Sinobaca qinghaiensis]|uniref:Dihydrofolate reductase n=1 Tax=Sinobaca qinghaiensis TaxID=342944 RepID=A0A419UW88_9BACL|nr:dihydrofolate reductase [Sinobaca qinghaiensis]RKD68843.1 dihydrofolate reductase [Sinobaca qinghaiensis]